MPSQLWTLTSFTYDGSPTTLNSSGLLAGGGTTIWSTAGG